MCDVTRDLQTPSTFANSHIFSGSSLLWSVKYFMHGRKSKTFKKRHSVIQRRPRPKLFRACGCYNPIHESCLRWPLRLELSFTLPASGITTHLISSIAEMTYDCPAAGPSTDAVREHF